MVVINLEFLNGGYMSGAWLERHVMAATKVVEQRRRCHHIRCQTYTTRVTGMVRPH